MIASSALALLGTACKCLGNSRRCRIEYRHRTSRTKLDLPDEVMAVAGNNEVSGMDFLGCSILAYRDSRVNISNGTTNIEYLNSLLGVCWLRDIRVTSLEDIVDGAQVVIAAKSCRDGLLAK